MESMQQADRSLMLTQVYCHLCYRYGKLKLYNIPNINTFFQVLLTKIQCFGVKKEDQLYF